MLTDYLRFSANSIKELIRLKLNENSSFTDQNFQDSNLSVFLDTLSYMYATLSYYLNHGASEAMFTDAQLYENMNRITKMLSYNPRGFVTSSVLAGLNKIGELPVANPTYSFVGIIPKYTRYVLNGASSTGTISYSFAQDYKFETAASETDSIPSIFTPRLYNGYWKFYTKPVVAGGTPFETFTLDGLVLTGQTRTYIAHNMIDVYVRDMSGSIKKYEIVNDLYNDSEATNEGYVYEARINENYQYTLKFGDGIYGNKLPQGGVLYVIYFVSDGPNGQIGADVMNDEGVFVPNAIDGLDAAVVQELLKLTGANYISQYILTGAYHAVENPYSAKLYLTNSAGSTFVQDFETVDEIRENAPVNFRIGGRLVTAKDFESYILHNMSNQVYDIKVVNNWEYMVDFQKWLYQYDRLSPDLRFFNYYYADSCDFNNVYLWVVPNAFNIKEAMSITSKDITYNVVLEALKVAAVEAKRSIIDTCDRIKCLTSELVPLDPLYVNITPHYKGEYEYTDWDPNKENKIQLIRDRNTLVTAEGIKQNAVKIIFDFFKINNCSLGMTLSIDSLYNKLMAISGVKAVRTKYLEWDDDAGAYKSENVAEYFDGLRFALWTNTLVQGADLIDISGNYKLRDFQFPLLYDFEAISDRVEVASDNYNIHEVEY